MKETKARRSKGPKRPTANDASPERVSLSEFVRGSDENNLAEFPLAALSDTVPSNQKTLEFQDTLKDWKTGQEITRRVCVTGSDKFGLPTAKDDQVLTALLQLTKIANNFTNPEVSFTKHQIVELLDWSDSGWAYDRVEESLHRWKGVSVHYWNAWRDHESQTWTDTEAIGVIDYFKLSDGRRTQGAAKRDAQSRFVWNRELFKSFQAGYMKPLDFGLYRSLKRPAAQRAYRFLDKRFHHRPDWEFDLHTFACEKLGFSRKYDTGQLKARLHPAMTELEQAGFIKPVTYHKVRARKWSLRVAKRTAERPKVPSAALSSSSTLAEKLIERGIAKSTASSLVEAFPPERIEEKIQFTDWLNARKDKRALKNAAGFLVAAIRSDYPLPNDFLKTVRKACSNGAIATPQPTREEHPDSPIEQHLATLSPKELEQLEAAAIESADPITAEGYRRSRKAGGPTFNAYRRMAIERYLSERIASQKKAA